MDFELIMTNKYLEKIAKDFRSEFSANLSLASPTASSATSGIPNGFNTLSKARMAGVKPAAKAGGVLEAVRKMRGLR